MSSFGNLKVSGKAPQGIQALQVALISGLLLGTWAGLAGCGHDDRVQNKAQHHDTTPAIAPFGLGVKSASINERAKKKGETSSSKKSIPTDAAQRPANEIPSIPMAGAPDKLKGKWRSFCTERASAYGVTWDADTLTADGKKLALGYAVYSDSACNVKLSESTKSFAYTIGKRVALDSYERYELNLKYDSNGQEMFSLLSRFDGEVENQLVLTFFVSDPSRRSLESYLKFVRIGD